MIVWRKMLVGDGGCIGYEVGLTLVKFMRPESLPAIVWRWRSLRRKWWSVGSAKRWRESAGEGHHAAILEVMLVEGCSAAQSWRSLVWGGNTEINWMPDERSEDVRSAQSCSDALKRQIGEFKNESTVLSQVSQWHENSRGA